MRDVRGAERAMLYAAWMTIQRRSIETARGDMKWLEAGAGWPVVLLHGFPLAADMWRPQLETVPDGWRFIAPDYMSPAAVTMDDYASDVFALMDGLKLDEAVIGGLSMGGYVTFAMHRLEPARFTGMVLADTRPQADPPQAREGRVQLRERLARDGPRGVAEQMLPKLLSAAARREDGEALRHATAMIEGAAPAAIDAAIGALMGRPDSTPGLSSISCSTVVIVGEHDEITPPAESEAMHRAIARSTLCVIPGAGHLSSLEQPATFSRGLADFLLARL
jgi:3-oxoadipate enol-lactonase